MKIFLPIGLLSVLMILCITASGCASDIQRVASGFTPAAGGTGRAIVITMNTEVQPSNSYKRLLMNGSKWKLIGHVAQGNVYEIQNDVFMLEAKHMHQAHLVLSSGNRLVGFFLPVEEAFVPLSPAIPLSVKNQ